MLFSFLPVILFDNSNPFLKPSSKDSFKVNDPFADPMVFSFCFDWLGINASSVSLNFNLFPDCDAKWTVGVQLPDTQIQSHDIFSNFS